VPYHCLCCPEEGEKKEKGGESEFRSSGAKTEVQGEGLGMSSGTRGRGKKGGEEIIHRKKKNISIYELPE